jgi:HTH-type transcriptional regulator, sugar sensing transcriptional regulator
MIMEQNFLNKLKELGLNSYESKLWTALLSRGISTAGELSDIANVPRSRTYDVLESLEKKGFIIMKIGKPIKYIAVSPTEVVERVKKNIQLEAESNRKILDDIKESEMLSELNILHSQGIDLIEPTDLSGCLKGRKSFYNHMESLINSANKSVLLMSTEKGIERKSEVLRNALKKAHKRGVDIKIATKLDSKKATDAMMELSEIATIKHSDKLKGRFLVADGKDIAFALLDGEEVHPTYDVGIWINTPFFGQVLHSMFEKVWDEMTPLKK